MKLSETLAATARKGKGYIGDEEEGAKNETRPEEQRNSDAIKRVLTFPDISTFSEIAVALIPPPKDILKISLETWACQLLLHSSYLSPRPPTTLPACSAFQSALDRREPMVVVCDLFRLWNVLDIDAEIECRRVRDRFREGVSYPWDWD